MKGSEKQIEWAKNIVDGWVAGINKIIEEANDRVANNSMPQAWADICTAVSDEITTKINAMDDAAIIIRDRNAPVAKSVFDIACARYNQLNK
jgi:hypothetical protein